MKQTKIIRFDFSEYVDKGELNYREEIQLNEDDYNEISKWLDRINDGRRKIMPFLCDTLKIRGKVLEMGAGSCWLGSELSKIDAVTEVVCLDISEPILVKIAPHVMDHLNADENKITRVVGDFNKMNFESGMFNFVIFDAALHHIPSESMKRVLKEVKRVLRDDGIGVGIREPFLSPVPIYNFFSKRSFGYQGKRAGAVENVFTYRQWRKKFGDAGFIFYALPYFRDRRYESKFKNAVSFFARKPWLKPIFSYLTPSAFGREPIIVFKKAGQS